MADTLALTSDRYRITEPWGGGRYLGEDRRLGRNVLLWVFPAANEDEQDAILGFARECARLSHPTFLQLLDLVPDDARTAIVLEAPRQTAQSAVHPLARPLPALVAATLTSRIGAALEEAAEVGLIASSLPLTYVHVSGTDDVRLDPVGLFTSGDGTVEGLVPLLTEFLASLQGDRVSTSSGAGFDPGADAVASFVARWRERAERSSTTDVSRFLGELRLIGGEPADLYRPQRVTTGTQPQPVIPHPPVRASADEETVPLHVAEQRMAARRNIGTADERGAYRAGYAPSRTAPAATAPHGSVLSRLFLGVGVVSIIAALGFGIAAVASERGGGNPGDGATPTASATPAPPDRATLTLAAQQDANVTVLVDGAVAFEGVLHANESRSWEGSTRVHVVTNNGKNLQVTVNGYELGALSPAVGHPEWNAVDWGWNAGETPAGISTPTPPPSPTGSGR